jgi:hypothetical protein
MTRISTQEMFWNELGRYLMSSTAQLQISSVSIVTYTFEWKEKRFDGKISDKREQRIS